MEAKERKMGLEKAAASFKCKHLSCFRYTFHNRCCCRENQAYDGFVWTTDFLEHLGILYDTFSITCKASIPLSQLCQSKSFRIWRHDRWVHQSYGDECQRNKQPQGGLNNEWSSRNSVPEYTNLYRASTEWWKSLMSKVTNVNPNYKDFFF